MLLWSDGFDKYGAGANLAVRYTIENTPSFSTTGGITGGGAVVLDNALNHFYGTFLSSSALDANSRPHVALWMKIASMPSGDRPVVGLVTNEVSGGSNFQGGAVGVSPTGQAVAFTHRENATVLARSAAGVFVEDRWHHVELIFNPRDSGGVAVVYVDGVQVLNFSGDTNATGTQPTSWIGVKVNSGGSGDLNIDDLIAWDINGSDFDYAQLSRLHIIETLDMDGDDAVQFTPLSGTNFSNIDDAAFHDTDTSYNASPTVGHVDLFTVEDQAATPDQILALVVHMRARKTAVGSVIMRGRLVVGATTSEGVDFPLTTSVAHNHDAWGKNPDTGVAWGNTDANTIKAGYEFQA